MQIRRACSRDYYCLREAVIAEEMKLSFISHHHSHENQLAAIETSNAAKCNLLQRPEPGESQDIVQL